MNILRTYLPYYRYGASYQTGIWGLMQQRTIQWSKNRTLTYDEKYIRTK